MTKFTNLWRLLMILLISSSVLVVQAQKKVSYDKANAKKEQKEEMTAANLEKEILSLQKEGLTGEEMAQLIISSLNEEQMKKLEEAGFTKEIYSGDEKALMQGLEFLKESENIFEVQPNKQEGEIDAVGTYSFSQAAGTYTSITGGTLLKDGTTTQDSWVSTAQTIPSFTFDGVAYTTAFVTSNGILTLGGTAPSAYTTTGISTTTGSGIAICPFSADLDRATTTVTTEIRWETVGNEIIFQWQQIKRYGQTESFDFQVRLNTVNGVIKFVYQLNSGPGSGTSYQPQVGIRTSTTDYLNRLVSTGTEDWATSLPGTANTSTCRFTSAAPAKYFTNGLTYTFTPPVPGTPLPPTNPSPANAATGVPISGNLTWTFGANTVTYDLWFGTTGNMTQVVTGGTAGATGSYAYSGLTNITGYQWQVIEHNGALFTNGPVWSFTTSCGSYTTPFVENFDGTTFPPTCWEKYSGLLVDPIVLTTTTSGWIQDDWRNIVTGDKAAKINIYSTTYKYWLVTPQIDLGAGGKQLEFDLTLNAYGTSNPPGLTGTDDKFAIIISTDGGLTWSTANILRLYDNAGSSFVYNNINPNGETVVLNTTGYSGIVKFGFYGESTVSNADNDLMINNLKVRIPPSCPDPSTLGASNITDISANLTWVSLSGLSDIEFGLYGFTPTGIPTDVGKTSPYAKTGLSPQTQYSFYVRDNCGSGNYSAWVGPYSFTTACGALSIPWSEGFESVTIPTLPNCWLKENGDWVTTNNANTTYDADAHTGTQFLRESYSATNEYVWTPGFALTSGTSYDFSFWWAGDTYSGWTGDIFYNTTQNSVGATQMGASFVENATVTTKTYAQVTRTLVPSVTGTYYFAIRINCPTTTPWYLSFDDFTLELSPACPNPQSLGVTAVTGVSADLTWTSFSGLSDIEFGPYGFTPTGIPTDAGKTSPYTKGGLSPVTQYSFYVRDNCGGGLYSNWVGPYSFYTACATFVAPFSETFQNTTIPNCWTMTGPQAWLFTTTWSDYGAEGVTDHTGTGGSYAGVDGSGSVSISGITLTSPLIDISALTNPALRFFIFNNNIDDASYQTLRVDLWDGAAWNNNVYFWGPTANDPSWVEVIVSLVPYTITGDIQFQFVVDKGPGSPYYDDLIIDDVTVGEGPTCPNPSNLGATNITTTSADLTWTSVSGLSDIEFGIAGFVPTGTPTDAGKTSPYTKGGLAASSSYEFYVRDDCGGGDYSDWVGPYAFDTPCEAVTLPYCINFDLSTFPVCWTQGYAPAVTSDRWNVNTTNLAGGTANEMHAAWQNVIGESWLTTPELLIPSGAILTFKHYYDDYGAGLTLSVRYSNDNGVTWNTGWTLASGGGNVGPETLTIPITVSGNVIIQWYMNGNHYQLDNWYVDDVCLVVPLAHDVSVSSIDMGDYYEPGTVVPKATVYNNGSNTESFNVNMTIGAYTSTKSVTALAPYTSVQVTFDNWNAAIGSYTAQVCTQLGGDLNTANDCQSKPVSVEVLRKIYCYIAYDPSAGLPEGPAWTSVQHPESITSLAATTSDQFISAGTWANGIWYGSEYYDATLLSGGGWWTINPTNGAMTKIGDYDKGFTGITYNPATGIMYGTYYNSTNVNSELYTINMATGQPTLVGVFTTQLIINLASNGSQFLYGFGIEDDQLYKIDPSVPNAVAVGATGFDFNYGQDMEYDFTNGIMYAAGYYTPDAGTTYTGHLMTVNLTTGACTDLGMFQGDSEITGMALPYTFGYKVSGNVYYGATGTTKPMATNTTVTLTPHGTTSTGVNGYYELNGVLAGSYTLTGATTKAAGGVQSADALLVQRYLLNALSLTNLQKRCADVNMSNSITVADPLAIKRKVLVPTFNWAAPGYVFDGPFGAPNPVLGGIPINVTTSDVTQELRTLCSGDVNASYTPPAE